MKNLRRIITKSKKIVVTTLVLMLVAMSVALTLPANDSVADDRYPIMGPTNVSLGQLINYYNSVTSFPAYYTWTDAPTLDAFCQMYIDECNAENVRVEVAFCQAMNETNYLRYTGRVPIEANNFAGIGAIDSDVSAWATFPSVREGIRAQVQHLKAYASTANLNNPCVDPRFHLVSRGCAPYLEDLSGRWASSPTYGSDIRYNFMAKLGTFTGFCTSYEGVDYSLVYDPSYYLDNYADVRALFANDGYGLLRHYVLYGMDEGRQANGWFNPYIYKNNYVDLRNLYGYNIGAYTRHYMICGEAEGRTGCMPNGSTDKAWMLNGVDYGAVYNYSYYTNMNPDVPAAIGVDDLDVLTHFVTCGMNEGRHASYSFDVDSYMREYPDLRAAFGHNKKPYYEHYVGGGAAEGRHGTGCTQRVGSISSLWICDFSDVYNYDYYISHNPDVAAAFGDDDISALEHFAYCGMNEGRRASDNFDVIAYMFNNPDLVSAFGLNFIDYYVHYIMFGHAEGRIAV